MFDTPSQTETRPNRGKLIWLLLLVLAALFVLGLVIPYENWLKATQQQLQELKQWTAENLFWSAFGFGLLYVAFTGLSLPGALFLTLLGGWLFGVAISFPLINVAATAGATIAFLSSRYLLRKRFSQQYAKAFQKIDGEFNRVGWLYLLALRLNPLFPFFVENILFGLTRMPTWQFWVVTQIGIIPLGFLYCSAGAQLAKITTIKGLVDPVTIFNFLGVSLAPFVGRLVYHFLVKPKQ